MREGYKDSALGEIPEDWGAVKLGTVCAINQRALKNTTDKDYRFRYLDLSSVKNGVVSIPDDFEVYESAPSRARRILKQNDVLFATVRPNLLGYGIVNFPSSNIISSTGFAVISEIGKTDNRFVYQNLYSKNIQKQIEKLIVGSNYPAINSSDVGNLVFPFPPLPEQQKIAQILSTVDEKNDIIDQQIAETTELKKGLMQTLLTKGIGHTEFKDSPLGEIPENWEVVKLGEVTKTFAGGTPRRNNSSYYNGDIPWVKSGEVNQRNILFTSELVTNKAIKETATRLISKNSVLIALYGATAGNVGMLRIEACSNQAVLSVNSINGNLINDYIYHYLKLVTNKLISYSQGSGQPNLSKGIIDSVSLPLPPIEEQQKLAFILSTVDDKLDVLKDKKIEYQELKKGLMQQLLTGKVRVS